jgi:MOSC domain-containing protein YiiM
MMEAGPIPLSDASATGSIRSVNVGRVRTIAFRDGFDRTAIWKSPVQGPVRVHGVNLEGDDQADRSVHGGPDKAVYAYAAEDLAWWSESLDGPVHPGTFGENLTTVGMDLADAVVGERWAVGTTVLEVTQPRIPCYKLGIRMGDPQFPRRFAAAARPGAYFRIISEGAIAAGDTIQVISRPTHDVTVGLIERAYHVDHSLAGRLVEAPELPDGWLAWARRFLRHRAS